MLLSVETCITV